jgi:hypothetical protein
MSIWGRRDSEPPAGEAHESQAGAQGTQPEPAAEHQGEEPAPAFWRAQGETAASLGRDPADAPPPAYEMPDAPPPAGVPAATAMGPAPAYGQQAPSEAPAGTDSAPPVGTGAPATEVPEPTVAVAREPVVNEAREPAAAEAERQAVAPAPAVTEARSGAHDSGITGQRWSEIMAAFVDDPRGSVKMAADAVDEAVDEFVNSVRARQQALSSSWEATGTETEQLRTALRDYRMLWHQVRQLDLAEKAGA